MDKNSERVVTLLSKDTVKKITTEAQKRGLSVSAYIRTLILEELSKKK